MALPQIDIKLVWLAEAGMTSNRVIDKLQEKEALGRKITPTEAEYAKICGAYLYLYNLAQESNLLDKKDLLNKTETIH
jgi:hypothetical protein|tara:strand:+ start:718 stop:951 length:234 start_codon:yes stop_codon:yes gene_type:complete